MALTVLITLASAAPMSVPPTPKKEATTAADTAASALAAIWTELSVGRGGSSAEVPARRSSVRVAVIKLRGVGVRKKWTCIARFHGGGASEGTALPLSDAPANSSSVPLTCENTRL